MKIKPTTKEIQESIAYAESLLEDIRNGNNVWEQVLDHYTVQDIKDLFENGEPTVYELAEFVLYNMILAHEIYLNEKE